MEHDILNEIITNTVGSLFLGSGCFFDTGHSHHHQGRSAASTASSSSGSLQLLKKKSTPEIEDHGKDSRAFLKMIDPNANSHQNRGAENASQKFKTPDTSIDRKANSANTSVGSIQLSVSSANKSRDETHSRSNSNGHQQVVNQNIPPNNENYNVEAWVKRDGPQKLYESLKRLNLDLNAINRINLSSLTVDEISTEKKRVKNELKRYDTAFSAVFKRIPSREEKEPMRPLYIYYKKLKQTIGRTDKPASTQAANPRSTTTTTPNTANPVVQKSSSGALAQLVMPDKNQRLLGSLNLLQEKENKTSSISQGLDKKLDSSFEYNLSKDATKELNFEPKMNNFFNQGSAPSHKHTNSKSSISNGLNYDQARKELEDLKKNRANLRDRLHSYQVDFTRNNNRKIKYHKDIVPVENEYKRYKEIKQEIQRLENLLGVA